MPGRVTGDRGLFEKLFRRSRSNIARMPASSWLAPDSFLRDDAVHACNAGANRDEPYYVPIRFPSAVHQHHRALDGWAFSAFLLTGRRHV